MCFEYIVHKLTWRLLVIIVHDVWFAQTFDVNDSDQGVIGYENPRVCHPGNLFHCTRKYLMGICSL